MRKVMGQYVNRGSINSSSLLQRVQMGGVWVRNLWIRSRTGKRPSSSFYRKIWTLRGESKVPQFLPRAGSRCYTFDDFVWGALTKSPLVLIPSIFDQILLGGFGDFVHYSRIPSSANEMFVPTPLSIATMGDANHPLQSGSGPTTGWRCPIQGIHCFQNKSSWDPSPTTIYNGQI